MEQQLHYPLIQLNATTIDAKVLQELDVLILPSGGHQALGEGTLKESPSAWVRDGGKIIAIDYALQGFAAEEMLSVKLKKEATEEEEPNLTAYATGNATE